MATYYEQLKISPTAPVVEIEAACDRLYHEWRRLVTHQDRELANRADRELAEVETMRATLTDPGKRAVYDAAIGVTGTMGGLADLNLAAAVPSVPPSPFGSPGGPLTRVAAASPKSPWACPNPACETENQPNTQYCLNCGGQLVRGCPECGSNTSMVRSGFCGKCGFKYEVAQARRELATQIDGLRRELIEAERQASEYAVRRKQPEATRFAGERDRLKSEVEALRVERARLDHRMSEAQLADIQAQPQQVPAGPAPTAQPAAPSGFLNAYMRFAPWVAMVFGAIGVIATLFVLVFGAALSPLFLLAGGFGAGGALYLGIIVGLLSAGLEFAGGYLMRQRRARGWWLLTLGLAVSLVANLLRASVVALILLAAIGFVHWRVRPNYH